MIANTADALDNTKIALDEYAHRPECRRRPSVRRLLEQAYLLVAEAEDNLRRAEKRATRRTARRGAP